MKMNSVEIFCSLWHGGTVVNFAASRLPGLEFSPELGLLSVQSLACSSRVCLGFLPPPKNMQVGGLVSSPGCIPTQCSRDSLQFHRDPLQ